MSRNRQDSASESRHPGRWRRPEARGPAPARGGHFACSIQVRGRRRLGFSLNDDFAAEEARALDPSARRPCAAHAATDTQREREDARPDHVATDLNVNRYRANGAGERVRRGREGIETRIMQDRLPLTPARETDIAKSSRSTAAVVRVVVGEEVVDGLVVSGAALSSARRRARRPTHELLAHDGALGIR